MLIVSGQRGRLGNQLWKQAHIMAFAKSSGHRLLNADFAPYAKHFPALESAASKMLRPVPTRLFSFAKKVSKAIHTTPVIEIGEDQVFDLDAEIGRLSAVRVALLSGFYFLAPHSLDRQKREVLAALAPHRDVLLSSAALINSRRSRSDVVVGVHVRQGDYRVFNEGRMHYEPREFAIVMRNIVEQLQPRGVSFVVCSDEPVDPKDYQDLNIATGPGDYIGDLHSLASCDYLLAAPSTYSQWASYYGSVPLHALNYKMESYYGFSVPKRFPEFHRDFAVATSLSFVPESKLRGAGLLARSTSPGVKS